MGRDTLSVTDNRTGKTYELPIENGAIRAKDLRQIRVDDEDYGLKSYDPAFLNTAACKSRITYIDGEKGILRYRGYPIEELAEKSNYLEVAYWSSMASFPRRSNTDEWVHNITHHTILHEYVKKLLDGFRYDAHPMGMLIGVVGALSTFYPDAKKVLDPASRRLQTYRLIAKMPTLAAFSYRHSIGMRYTYPDNDLSYTGNFLKMTFAMTERVQAEPGARAGARRALHPPRGPRAELLDQRHERRRKLAVRPVLRDRGGGGRSLRAAPRRRERGRPPDAERDRKQGQGAGVRQESASRAKGVSWASDTGSTRATIRGPRSSSRPPAKSSR